MKQIVFRACLPGGKTCAKRNSKELFEMILALINATKGKVSVQFYCFTFESHVVTAKRKCIHKLKVFENLIHYNRDL